MHATQRTRAALATVLALAAHAAAAQCDPGWIQSPEGGINGVDGTVSASILWDPDGAGPHPELLVVGGMFSVAGQTAAANVAAWDGLEWRDVGGGVHDGLIFERVSALGVYDGKLIVGGHFGRAGDEPVGNIAAWDGSAWSPLGAGVSGGFSEPEVKALLVQGDELVVAGAFAEAGGGSANGVAVWDGEGWSALGSGLSGAGMALLEHGGDLYVGGQFQSADGVSGTANLARWDGAAWNTVGGGASDLVNALAAHGGAIYAGGLFNRIGGLSAQSVARWDGSAWSALGSGVGGTVTSLSSHHGLLYVGGRFAFAGGQAASNVAAWDGASWSALGEGVGDFIVHRLMPWGESLFVGGFFDEAGGQPAGGMALWDGGAWHAVGVRGLGLVVRALGVFEGDLFAAGYVEGTTFEESGVARWDGFAWSPVGGVMDEQANHLGTHAGELYAAGWFTEIDGVPIAGVARWDGAQWRGLGDGLAGGFVTSGLCFHSFGGDLIVGGDFETADGVPAVSIARWDGGAWHDLAGGVGGETPMVHDMTLYGDELVVVGAFKSAGGVAVSHVARWDGAGWSDVGGGVAGGVVGEAHAAVVFEGDLIVGGDFSLAGGRRVLNIARWDGAAWQPMGAGLPTGVEALIVSNGQLIAGCTNVFDDQSEIRRLARWNGASWESLGGGVEGGSVVTLAQLGPELMVGGTFSLAGDTASPFWARWSDTGAPWLTLHPADAAACRDGDASFAASVPLGYEDAAYQWRRDGQPLADGPTGTGSVVSGATTPELSIANVSGADGGAYDCVVSNTCGDAISDAALLGVCDGDFDCDGLVNTLDVLAFLNAWTGGGGRADFNRDGVINTQDVLAFLNAWTGGC